MRWFVVASVAVWSASALAADVSDGGVISLPPVVVPLSAADVPNASSPTQRDPSATTTVIETKSRVAEAKDAAELIAASPGAVLQEPSTATETLPRWAPGARARALLERYRVNVNDPANGVRLGEPIPHNYTHREVFLSRLEADLENTVRKLELQGAAPEVIGTRLVSRLRTIGAEVEAELAGGAPSSNAYWTKE